MAEAEIKGERVDGKAFYSVLNGSDDFCQHLGRAVLAAGRLETSLKRYLRTRSVNTDTSRMTLGQLIKILEQHSFLSKMQPSLDSLKRQRNFLTHNIHAFLFGEREEELLGTDELENLLDSDVVTYSERAWQLTQNLNGLADIVEREYRSPKEAVELPI